ncbi:1-acyl-sn-glycerol-3-phosphate acyltransferase [Candidatus Woesearchaeota archaeon]|nr:1-acyl-sn-glycerol-3-phosphate acyltransferase [Candidatus Woesearchaeota archaeon]
MENIPNDKRFIAVSNHEKLVDPLYIIYAILQKLNKKVHFLSSAKWWFLGETICRQWAGCIPLFNKKQAFEESKQLLKSGEIVGIFPEGGLKKTKNPKTGAVRLAIETNTPILPIGVKSSYIPFSSTLNIGKLTYIKNKKNIERQTLELMKHVYELRNSG